MSRLSHQGIPVPHKGKQVSGLSQDVCSLVVSRAVDKLDLVGLNHGACEVVAQVDVLELGRRGVLDGVQDASLVVLKDWHSLLKRHS